MLRLPLLVVLSATVVTAFCAEASLDSNRQATKWIQGATITPREDAAGAKCEFVGNADFYGLGVRIGFYLLWLSGLIDFLFNPSSSAAVGDAQTIFDFANLIAIIVLNGQQPPAEDTTSFRYPVFVPIILLYMFFGGAVVSATTTASRVVSSANRGLRTAVCVIILKLRSIFEALN